MPAELYSTDPMAYRPGARQRPLVALKDYQRMAVDTALARGRVGLFLGIGTGKTLTSLEWLWEANPKGHVLIVGPQAIMRATWTDEMAKWGFRFRTGSFVVDGKGKRLGPAARKELYGRLLTDEPTVWMTTRDLVGDLKRWLEGHTRGKAWPFDAVVVDEAQSFKAPNAKRSKALAWIVERTPRLLLLTGTPAPNGYQDIYSLVRMIDGGARLGSTFTAYRDRYFDPVRYVRDATGVSRPVEFDLKPGAERAIHDRISDVCISYDDVRSLMPPVTVNDVTIDLTDEQSEVYREMSRESVVSFVDVNGEEAVEAALTKGVLHNRLLQIASGTMYAFDMLPDPTSATGLVFAPKYGDDGERLWSEVHDAKISALRRIVEEAGSPVLVAYRYRSEVPFIRRHLDDLGVVAFDGDPDVMREWNDGRIPVMLIQPAQAGFGLNLQGGGHTLVWFTLPDSLEHYEQTIGRLHRTGQTDPVMVHRLVVRDSVDEDAVMSLSRKASRQGALMDAVTMSRELEIVRAATGLSLDGFGK